LVRAAMEKGTKRLNDRPGKVAKERRGEREGKLTNNVARGNPCWGGSVDVMGGTQLSRGMMQDGHWEVQRATKNSRNAKKKKIKPRIKHPEES